MIRYNLVCDRGHGFESWFANSQVSERQLKRHAVSCPDCGSIKVKKAIMAPAVTASAHKSEQETLSVESRPVALLSEKEQTARNLIKAMREYVKQHAEHVGEKFPKLAREMHYGEVESRSIYGEAKSDEVRELQEEGIEVAPLPVLPDERH